MRYVSGLACPTCGSDLPGRRVMNLCPDDGRPVQVVIDLDRLKAERGKDGWWTPTRPDLWRFGGLALTVSMPRPSARNVSRPHAGNAGDAWRYAVRAAELSAAV